MIKRIEVSGFKSLVDFKLDLKPGLNILVGCNPDKPEPTIFSMQEQGFSCLRSSAKLRFDTLKECINGFQPLIKSLRTILVWLC